VVVSPSFVSFRRDEILRAAWEADCGDVLAARSAAEALLRRGGLRTQADARILLTAVILDLTSRADRAPASNDVRQRLLALTAPGGHDFTHSPVQFLRFAHAEWTGLSERRRSRVVSICLSALESLDQTDSGAPIAK
jgi:hypothetical protein